MSVDAPTTVPPSPPITVHAARATLEELRKSFGSGRMAAKPIAAPTPVPIASPLSVETP